MFKPLINGKFYRVKRHDDARILRHILQKLQKTLSRILRRFENTVVVYFYKRFLAHDRQRV